MFDLRLVFFYLGMAITWDYANCSICFRQQAYLKFFFQGYRIWDCKAVAILIDCVLTTLLQNYQATNNFWI